MPTENEYAQTKDMSGCGKALYHPEEREDQEEEGVSQPHPDEQIDEEKAEPEARGFYQLEGCHSGEEIIALRLRAGPYHA